MWPPQGMLVPPFPPPSLTPGHTPAARTLQCSTAIHSVERKHFHSLLANKTEFLLAFPPGLHPQSRKPLKEQDRITDAL